MPGAGKPGATWPWVVAICVCSAATGIAFVISVGVGIAMACVTIAVMAGCFVWIAREARRRRAAGQTPNIPDLQQRIRRRLRWHVPLALLTVVAAGVAVATKRDNMAAWILVALPIMLLIGLGLMWFVAERLLPKVQRKPQGRPDEET